MVEERDRGRVSRKGMGGGGGVAGEGGRGGKDFRNRYDVRREERKGGHALGTPSAVHLYARPQPGR